MAYALINSDGSLAQTMFAESFTWKGLQLTAVNYMPHSERKSFGIYDYTQLYQETPEGKKQCGFSQEVNHEQGVVYEIPIFIDKTEAELAREKNEKIKAEITAIESSVTPRRYREAVLSDVGKDWLVAQDVKINELRAQLVPEVPEISIPAE